MQFFATHNSPQNYWHLVESNFLHKDDYNHSIHKPRLQRPYKPGVNHIPGYGEMVQSNGQFHTNHNSKTSYDNFNYTNHLLDNFYDPIHNNELVHNTSFINNKNENPYKNGDARNFFNYNPNLPYNRIRTPYTNNYGYYSSNMNWDPYLNPKKNFESYLSQQVVKASDRKKMLESNRENVNNFYPRNINPYSSFVKDFNPSDNFVTGRNNFNMAYGDDTPLNHLQPPANVNIPPDAPDNIDTGPLDIMKSNQADIGPPASTPSPPVPEAFNINTMEHFVVNNISPAPNIDSHTTSINTTSNIVSPNTPAPDITTMSISDLFYNLGKVFLDIINDLVKFTEMPDKTFWQLWYIFTRTDRIAYVGIMIVIIAIIFAFMT